MTTTTLTPAPAEVEPAPKAPADHFPDVRKVVAEAPAAPAPAVPVALNRYEASVQHGEPWMELADWGDWVSYSDFVALLAREAALREAAGRLVQGFAVPVAPTESAAKAMGAFGGPVNEQERLAFEAWMRGHCWALCATWDGAQYKSDAEHVGNVDPHAMRTRQLWAAWRDRAALQSDAIAAALTAARESGRLEGREEAAGMCAALPPAGGSDDAFVRGFATGRDACVAAIRSLPSESK